jgi:hypothetical protein
MPQIINLSPIGEVLPGDSLPIFDESNGDTRRVSVDQLETYMQNNLDMPDNSDEVSFLQAGTGAVTRTVQSKLRDVVSVKDFGAVGDGVTDDTAAIQAAIVYAQSANKILLAPAGTYRITSTLTPSTTQPFHLIGEGRGAFDQTTLGEKGTIFNLYTANTALFRTATNAKVSHTYENFMCVNKSGGSAEIAFNARTAIFCYYRDITIAGFQFGVKGENSIWLTFDRLLIRDCDYGISLWQSVGTPPYSLNTTYYNNVISIRDCLVTDCITGFRVAGAGIQIVGSDASRYSDAGFEIGGADFNVTSFSMDNIYTEGATGTPFKITNAFGDIGTIFFGQGFTTGLSVTSSRITIEMLYAYATLTTGISNNNSRVWVTHYSGPLTTVYSNTGTGKTYIQQLQTPVESSAPGITLTQGQSTTIASAVMGNYLTDFTLRIDDNGTAKTQKYILRGTEVKSVTMQDTPSTYLTVSSALNGTTGRYDVTLANTAGFAFNITLNAYAFTPLNLVR